MVYSGFVLAPVANIDYPHNLYYDIHDYKHIVHYSIELLFISKGEEGREVMAV